MKHITLYRRDFREPDADEGDVDFFADILMELGYCDSYEEAVNVEEINLVVDFFGIA